MSPVAGMDRGMESGVDFMADYSIWRHIKNKQTKKGLQG